MLLPSIKCSCPVSRTTVFLEAGLGCAMLSPMALAVYGFHFSLAMHGSCFWLTSPLNEFDNHIVGRSCKEWVMGRRGRRVERICSFGGEGLTEGGR